MNLVGTLNIYAGGEGSGPNAPCPQCGPHKHGFEEKDIVKLKNPDTLYNFKTGNIDKFGSGLKAVVVNVLPKVGDNPQMVKVNIMPPTKKHEADQFRYFKADDLSLHKTEAISPEVSKVRPSQTLLKFKTSDGADVTWVKPQLQKEQTVKSLDDLSRDKHYLYGKFGAISRFDKPMQDRPGYSRVSRLYDTTIQKAYLTKGTNAVVWVDVYKQKGKIKDVKINEQNYTTYGTKTRGTITFSYKNAAKAVGMLKARYGITQKLEWMQR